MVRHPAASGQRHCWLLPQYPRDDYIWPLRRYQASPWYFHVQPDTAPSSGPHWHKSNWWCKYGAAGESWLENPCCRWLYCYGWRADPKQGWRCASASLRFQDNGYRCAAWWSEPWRTSTGVQIACRTRPQKILCNRRSSTVWKSSAKSRMRTNIQDEETKIMQSVPQDLLKEYVQSQHFTSTTEIMEAMKECSWLIKKQKTKYKLR